MGNYIFFALVLVSFFGLGKLFTKAGVESWKAYIPFYNFYVLARLLDKPWWWCLIMVVPGVNIIMYGVYGFNVARAFNKPSNQDLLFASLLPYLFFVKIGLDPTAKFVGLSKYKIEPSKIIKNWIDPIIFAVIAASIIRGYFIEAFTIPTPSLEKSLMVGDFLFVNKFAYGPKIPQTPLSFPFAHHTLPWSATQKSYLEWIKLPYFRLPGFGSVKNDQIVVFNYPDGDTVFVNFQDRSYYQLTRDLATDMKADGYRVDSSTRNNEALYLQMAREYLSNPKNDLQGRKVGHIASRPVDKREHYVKRCVGIAGDKLSIVNGDVVINDRKQAMPEMAQHYYYVKTTNKLFGDIIQGPTPKFPEMYTLTNYQLLDELDIYADEAVRERLQVNGDTTTYFLNMPPSTVEKVKQLAGVVSVTKYIQPVSDWDPRCFPHDRAYRWNNDNFGPLMIPKKGMTLPIDTHNFSLYEKILNTYDDGIHELRRQGGQVLYDGQPITSYTFKQDYYFMMGDNRHNSADSRSWGMVPYDHIVGSPFFVWFSMKYPEKNLVSGTSVMGSLFKNSKEGKFRWERFLSYVNNGTLHSVKIPFLLTILGIWGLGKWNTRRKQKAGKAASTN